MQAPYTITTSPVAHLLDDIHTRGAIFVAGQDKAIRKYIPVDLLQVSRTHPRLPGIIPNLNRPPPLLYFVDQIPSRVSTRSDAVTAIRMCDRLCTLICNQEHCIKNGDFLIVALIENVFVQVGGAFENHTIYSDLNFVCSPLQVVPIPRPRGVNLDEEDLYRSGRSERRAQAKKEDAAAKAAERKKKLEEKKTTKDDVVSASGKGVQAEGKSSASEQVFRSTEAMAASDAAENRVTPDFEVGKLIEEEITQSSCIWSEPITYELQVRPRVYVYLVPF